MRRSLAAIDTRTGTLAAWNPSWDGPVTALAAGGTTLYAAGGKTVLSRKFVSLR